MSSANRTSWREAAGFGWPRVFAAGLGLWLIVSTFFWEHTTGQQVNGLVCGALAILFSIAASLEPRARYLNTALGVWVLFSALFLPGRPATLWLDILTGPALIAVSLVPAPPTSNVTRLRGT